MGAPHRAIRLSVERGLLSTPVLPLDPPILLTYRGFQMLRRKADYMAGGAALLTALICCFISVTAAGELPWGTDLSKRTQAC